MEPELRRILGPDGILEEEVHAYGAKDALCSNCEQFPAEFVTWVTRLDMMYVCRWCDVSLAAKGVI